MTIFGRFIALRPHEVPQDHIPLVGFASLFIACKQSGKCMRAASLCRFLRREYITESSLKVCVPENGFSHDSAWKPPFSMHSAGVLMVPSPTTFSTTSCIGSRSRRHRRKWPRCRTVLKCSWTWPSAVCLLMHACADVVDASYVTYGPAMTAAAAMYCAITGIGGDTGDAPLYTNIPSVFHATCFGLTAFFPTNGDKIKVAECVQLLHRLYAAYSSRARPASATPVTPHAATFAPVETSSAGMAPAPPLCLTEC